MLALGQLMMSWMDSMLLPLTRLGAFFATAPLFPQMGGNARIRIVYAAVLCILMLPVLPTSLAPPASDSSGLNLLLIIQEAIIGSIMGLALQCASAAIITAGEQISQAMGLGFAQSFDPSAGSTPVISQFLNVLSLMIFLSAGGHIVVISMVAESLRVVPPGQVIGSNIKELLDFSAVVFNGAALISAPLVLAMVAVNIGVGALSRATPSLNVFSVGFAVSLIGGGTMLFLLIPVITDRIADLWLQSMGFIHESFRVGN
jgi:flagellar biosynthetic protein FliR